MKTRPSDRKLYGPEQNDSDIEIFRCPCQRFGRGVQRSRECPGHRCFGFCAVYQKSTAVERSRARSRTRSRRSRSRCEADGYAPAQILPHDSYLINLGHPSAPELEKSRTAFIDEMKRCEALGLDRLNFHPGSHLGKISLEECLDRVTESIDLALACTQGVTAVIENTAGQGSNVGFSFCHLAEIIARVKDKQQGRGLDRYLPRVRGRIRPLFRRGLRADVRRVRRDGRLPLLAGHAPQRLDEADGQPGGPPPVAGRRNDRAGRFPLHRPRQTVRRYAVDSRNARSRTAGRPRSICFASLPDSSGPDFFRGGRTAIFSVPVLRSFRLVPRCGRSFVSVSCKVGRIPVSGSVCHMEKRCFRSIL